MLGPKKLPEWLRKVYLKVVDNTCEECGKKGGIEVHRIIQGYNGGTYIMHNIKCLCENCHKLRAEIW